MDTIRTGNSSRDADLRNDKWLDAKKHPFITFKFQDVALPGPLEAGKPVQVRARGQFTIRGVTREEPVDATAVFLPESDETKHRHAGDLLRVRARFRIELEAYDIRTRRLIVLKVGERADVTVDAWGSTKL